MTPLTGRSEHRRNESAAGVAVAPRPGVHLRVAAAVVRMADSFSCTVVLRAHGAQAKGTSLLGVLSLGVLAGDSVTILARGPGARFAVEAIREVIVRGMQRGA